MKGSGTRYELSSFEQVGNCYGHLIRVLNNSVHLVAELLNDSLCIRLFNDAVHLLGFLNGSRPV